MHSCTIKTMLPPTDLLLWGIVAHLVADWLLQTEWMALNKSAITHPASWAHASVHLILMLLVFSWPLAVGIAATHLVIDTRIPIKWWMRTVKRMPPTVPNSFVIETTIDQIFHIVVLVVVVLFFV